MRKIVILLMAFLFCMKGFSQAELPGTVSAQTMGDHKELLDRITRYYPEQFTDPEKKKRKTFSQFGYNLFYFSVPFFPITKFIRSGKFGYHSYGKPDRSIEKNGSLYTCRGGFIDFSHMRAGIDWTVYLTFEILKLEKEHALPPEAGTLTLKFNDIHELSLQDILDMAQKIAFERLLWHEAASWHYHKPYHTISEQASAFTPEDLYSNMLGTVIGKRVAMRMLRDTSKLSYSAVATGEIENMIRSLQPMQGIKESKYAYDIVDIGKQCKLPAAARNYDVWYDSRIVFRDQRYAFKRYTATGPGIDPWLVPGSEQLGCARDVLPEVLQLRECTASGRSLYDYYEFSISPDSNMFFDSKKNSHLHPAFATFTTQNFGDILRLIKNEMALVLGPGFDTRDCMDPTIHYVNVNRVLPR